MTTLTQSPGADYYLLDELLTDEARAVRDRVRAFVDTEVLPIINDYWDRAEFPFELVGKIAQLGIVGTTIDGYGCPGAIAAGHLAGDKLAGANSFRDATRVLTATRGGAAWESLGHAAYEIALNYAQERIQFGKPIAGFQLVQHKLAGMLGEITAMQLYCFRMAELQEQGRWTGPMASLATLHHARKARQVCLDARDILGGNGLLLEYNVARHLTDMEVVHTYEGTDSIQSLIVGRDITGIPAFG
jgi:alkylation response protein AidB-like acyl-CoA dehydrogenase